MKTLSLIFLSLEGRALRQVQTGYIVYNDPGCTREIFTGVDLRKKK